MAHKHIPATVDAARELLEAYLAARYEVRGPDGTFLLRPGQMAPARLAEVLPGGCWTVITAWNPGSQVCTGAENRHADAALQSELDGLGLRRLPTLASDADGNWPEPGWLVANLPATGADALARRFGQAAVLHWRAGEPVGLRMYLTPPDGVADPGGPVEWIAAKS